MAQKTAVTLRAGTLRHQIQIQQQTTAQDGFGQPLQTWTTAYTCWSAIASVQASQLFSAAQFVDQVTHWITVRFTPAHVFAANQRIVFVEPLTGITHTYEIRAVVNENQANVALTLHCYELQGTE
jgi:SPP1 family predicted phage head-tail adaptor